MSDSPTAPSGYGNATRFVCAGLAKLGYDVSIIGWQTSGRPRRWRNCTLYPNGRNLFGADVLLDYLRHVRPDVLVTQAEYWKLTYIANPVIARFMREAHIPWALYYPVDCDMGDGRLPSGWVRLLQTVDLPITVSHYDRDVTHANGVTVAYIPYSVDTKVFRPPDDKSAAKSAMGYDGRFVLLSDARNQLRKLWPRTLEIFRLFAADKDDVLLHLHCDPNDPSARTGEYHYNLQSDIRFLGLADKVRFTTGMTARRGVTLARLAACYQAADVHLLASYGEGFGLPTLQAAAAGVVPMASDYTASRELVLGHGEAIRVRHFVRDQLGFRCALIDIDNAVGKLERLYRDRELLKSKSQAARRFAESYDWKHIVLRWHELLQREVPHLRTTINRGKSPAPRTIIRPRADQATSALPRAGRRACTKLPEGMQAMINKLESIGGHVSAAILRDMSNTEGAFTIPVALPPTDPALVGRRVIGRVYLASACDIPVFRKLHLIFPALSPWSTVALDLSSCMTSGRAFLSAQVPANSSGYQNYLATSTLALDLGGAQPTLPALAAEVGVPCIGLDNHGEQVWLWPDLCMDNPDAILATKLGRWMLTDHGDAAAVCALAWKRRYQESVKAVACAPQKRKRPSSIRSAASKRVVE